MLQVRNLEAGYGKLRVLQGVSLHVSPGEIVAIIGANGAGKTTLLQTISGLIRRLAGVVEFNGKRIDRIPVEHIVMLGCSLVQEGRRLFDTMSVRENLILGAYLKGRKGRKQEVRNLLEETYTLFPVLEERDRQLAGTLSGGEQQMLAIGRALMMNPIFIMMDEPSMGIAPLITKRIFETIAALRRQGKTILLVEQNARAALDIADRGYVLETGRIVLAGRSEELLDNHDVQRAYLGKDYKSIDE